MVDNVKSALTRKWGPLPAWAWFTGLFLVVYFYRKNRGAAAAVSGTGTGSVAPASGPPQAQTTLQPGESVYDPNSGALLTAPGNPMDSTASSAAELGAAMDSLAGAIASGMPPEQVFVNSPDSNSATVPTSGSKSGNSHNSTKRKPKPKIRGKIKPAKRKDPTAKKRIRSNSHVRNPAGGRTARHGNPGGTGGFAVRVPHGAHPADHGKPGQASHASIPTPSRARQRPRIAPVTTVSNQRRPAQVPTQRPEVRPTPAPAPRPSAPAPRTQRSPSPAGHRPTARKR